MNDAEIRNDDICPNCMEPVSAGAAVCPSCGAPMTEGETGEDIQAATGCAVESAKSPDGAENSGKPGSRNEGEKGKKPNVMQNITRGMGVYLIYIAVTNGYRVLSNPASLELEAGTKNYWLALVSNVVYLAAGLLAVWPWIKEYLDKRKRIEDAVAAEKGGVVVDGSAETVEIVGDFDGPAGSDAAASIDLEEIRRAADAELNADAHDETE